MKEVGYQLKYIKKVAETATEFLEDKFQQGNTIVFQAPTGSGKTYMISQVLTQIVKKRKVSYSFIWISVNSLHEQSRQNLSRYLEEERLLDCISIDEIQNKTIEENEIVFFNWDILIIDESHRTARATKALEVIAEIAPTLTIEVTATPKEIRGTLIKIPIAEVIVEI